MNFLAHCLLATEFLPPVKPTAYYIVGSALPDLLPLAAPRRFRLSTLPTTTPVSFEANALIAGARVHLQTDDAFHKTTAFQDCQSAVGQFVTEAGFEGIRVRRFFLAHVLTELALDAVLLRRRPALMDVFYSAFDAVNLTLVTDWAAGVMEAPLPHLPDVLARFAASRYLNHYTEDAGVAEGLSRLSVRARQDAFTGENRQRLKGLVTQSVSLLNDHADSLLAETASVVSTEK